MQIVYNSEHYYIIEYPAQEGYEVVDKHTQRGTFFHGDVAAKFRSAMSDVVGDDPSTERVDEFLSEFGALINFPVVYH